MKKLIWSEVLILLAGTIFAWGNFTWEMISYLRNQACPFGCAVGVVNPLYTPCFYGAIFFTIAFILSVAILIRYKKI